MQNFEKQRKIFSNIINFHIYCYLALSGKDNFIICVSMACAQTNV